jgi:hypothetical protein
VKDSDVVTALAKLLSSDEGIRFSHGKGSEAFVDVEEFHEVMKLMRITECDIPAGGWG